MNAALLILGANTNAPFNIALAQKILANYFTIAKKSSIVITKPLGAQYNSDFLNIAIEISTFKTKEETISILKKIETDMGRTPESKIRGQIPIDIDLISWKKKIEHEDYNKFDFVRKCIDELINGDITS